MGVRLAAVAIIASIALSGGIARVSISNAEQTGAPDSEQTGDVIVKFKPGATLSGVGGALDAAEAAPVDVTEQSGLVLAEPEAGQTVDEAVAELASHPDVLFAEPNTIMRIAVTPTDPHYASYQWNLPQIGLPTAWDTTTGNSNVIIAVLDTGVQSTHPDLAGKVTTGAEAGYNFVGNNTNTTDDHSHGTFVAGIIAANTNNGAGGAGVCWSCKIMAVKVLDNTGSGSTFNVAQGIDWAVSHGADVVNLSLGGGGASALQTAVDNAWNAGVIVVAATGNDNGPVLYPSAYSNAIAVGSNEQDGSRSSFSNFGPEIDIMAPGGNVLGTLCSCNGYPGGYGTGSGTSFAAPHVAGVVGLMIASGITDKNEIRSRIQTTATNMDVAGFDNNTGWGRIDAASAIQGVDTTPPTAGISAPTDGASVTGSVAFDATASDASGIEKVRFWVDYSYLGFDASAPYGKTWNTSGAAPGVHILKIEAIDNAGNSTFAQIAVSIVDNSPPTANITLPTDGAAVSGVVSINATATDTSGISKVRFWAGSSYLGFDASAPYQKSWDTSGLAGSRILKIEAIDNAGNSTFAQVTVFIVDSTSPAASITSPADGATVSGLVNFAATATDATGIAKVRFWAGSSYLGFDASAPYAKTWDTSSVPPGNHTLTIEAIDNGGNSTFRQITVSISDSTPPTASITSPLDGATVSGAVTITATASDNYAVQKVRFWVDPWYLGFDASGPYQATWDTTTRPNGTYTIRVQAVDTANNVSSWATITVTVSN